MAPQSQYPDPAGAVTGRSGGGGINGARQGTLALQLQPPQPTTSLKTPPCSTASTVSSPDPHPIYTAPSPSSPDPHPSCTYPPHDTAHTGSFVIFIVLFIVLSTDKFAVIPTTRQNTVFFLQRQVPISYNRVLTGLRLRDYTICLGSISI